MSALLMGHHRPLTHGHFSVRRLEAARGVAVVRAEHAKLRKERR